MEQLEATAKTASKNAYCRYSKFPVGAAVETKSGRTYSGCNVENVSFGLTMCAERNAIAAMIAAGETDPVAVVIFTPTTEPTLPCGACRQVLNEFNGNIRVRSVCNSSKTFDGKLGELLPHAFPIDSVRTQ